MNEGGIEVGSPLGFQVSAVAKSESSIRKVDLPLANRSGLRPDATARIENSRRGTPAPSAPLARTTLPKAKLPSGRNRGRRRETFGFAVGYADCLGRIIDSSKAPLNQRLRRRACVANTARCLDAAPKKHNGKRTVATEVATALVRKREISTGSANAAI